MAPTQLGQRATISNKERNKSVFIIILHSGTVSGSNESSSVGFDKLILHADADGADGFLQKPRN